MCYLLSALLLAPSTATSSSSSITGERVEALEGSLLNMFGLKRRPRPQRGNIVIPQFLVELYRHQNGVDVDTTNLDLKGKLTQTANTVRTFTHQEWKGAPKAEKVR